MKTVRVLKPYLNHKIGSVIQVRDQDADLLIPRGVVVEVEVEEETDEDVSFTIPVKAKVMTTKSIVKPAPPAPPPPRHIGQKTDKK